MSQDTTSNTLKRVILTDSPSEIDEFSGGGHRRTATALADTILQFDDSDQAIGLEGSWGAGKSTIVKLAEGALETSDKKHRYHVFTFDLWANQTGHFKRAFLESFLSWSSLRFPAQNDFLEQKKSQVGDRTQVVTTQNSKKFSWFGVAAIIFLYFSPLIYAWLTPAAFVDAQGEAAVKLGAKIAWAAIGLMSVILFLAIASFWPAKGGKLEKLQQAVSGAFAIFSKEAERTDIEQNIRDEDPTKYEFTKIFREIVAKLQAKKDRIVVVFDNIDRLPSDRIADEWSEVRSAFYGDHSGNLGTTAIIAIVPYARSVALPAVSNDKDAGYVEADLFRKSFDAIFHVSPPILSDVANFFENKFQEATLGHYSDNTASRVYRIFDLQIQRSGRPTTPRQVIAFINDVTSWWIQWQGQIPVETIAVFVAYQEELVRDPGILRGGGVIEARMVRHANQPDLVRDLAALAYNVAPTMALQVLSHDAIRLALVSENHEQLEGLVAGAPENGFFEVLPQVVDQFAIEWSENPLVELSNVASNIISVGQKAELFDYPKRLLAGQAGQMGAVTISDLADATKIWNLVGLVEGGHSAAELSQKIVNWVSKCLPTAEQQEFVQGRHWIAAIGKALDQIEKSHGVDTVQTVLPHILPPDGAKAIVGAAYDCDQTSYHMRQFNSAGYSNKSVIDALTEYAQNSEEFHYAWPELEHLFTDKEKVTLLGIPVDHLKATEIEGGSDELQFGIKNIEQIFSSISVSERSNNKAVKEFFESGAAVHHAYRLHQADKAGVSEALASLIWMKMEQFGLDQPSIPNVQGVPTFGNIQSDLNWFVAELESDDVPAARSQLIAKHVINGKRIGHFIKCAAKEPDDQELFKSVLRSVVADPDLHAPKFRVFVENFGALERMLGDKFTALLSIIGAKDSQTYWASVPFETLPTDLVQLAEKRGESGWSILLNELDKWLGDFDTESWTTAISDNTALVRLLALRNDQSGLKVSPASFYDPLLNNALAVVAGEHENAISKEHYERLIDSLPPNFQAQFSSDLFKRHTSHSEGIKAALAAFPSILSAMPFQSSPTKAIEGYLLPLLREMTEEADSFVIDHASSFKQVLKGAEEGKSGLVSEYLDGLDESEANADRVSKLRRSLGIKAKPKKKSKDDVK